MVKKVSKTINRAEHFFQRMYTKFLLRTHEHVFQYQGVPLKYLFVPKKSSDTLVIIFSGMNPQRASYSYLNLLNGVPYSRLYILDDFGDPILGCFYRGTNLQKQVERAVDALLESIIDKYRYNRLVFCGSSKGAYAALNFGILYPNATIVAGAPQYYLGYYLTHRRSPQLLHIIAGDNYTDEDIKRMDRHLCDKLIAQSHIFRGKIYLHYSTQEHTYSEHIQHLLAELKLNGYIVEEDAWEYCQHDDVALYFPLFLKQVLSEL